MKKFVKISAVLLSAMLALTGCSNKELEEANATIAQLTEENESLNAQVTELLQDMEDNSGISTDSETTISSYSTTPEVNTVDDLNSIVHIDGLLEYTNSYQAPNTSSINLVDSATITPSANWSVRIDGTTSYYSHPTGVLGTIKMSNMDSEVDSIYYQEDFIDPFLQALPHDGVKTSRIYVNTKYAGLSTETSIQSNQQPAILKFGVFGRGQTACVYCFYYPGKMDVTKSELVDTLIGSMSMEQGDVKVE